jgi:hypothetical protein
MTEEAAKEQYVEFVESMNIGWARQGEYEVDVARKDKAWAIL